jgi:hypothetical protein
MHVSIDISNAGPDIFILKQMMVPNGSCLRIRQLLKEKKPPFNIDAIFALKVFQNYSIFLTSKASLTDAFVFSAVIHHCFIFCIG